MNQTVLPFPPEASAASAPAPVRRCLHCDATQAYPLQRGLCGRCYSRPQVREQYGRPSNRRPVSPLTDQERARLDAWAAEASRALRGWLCRALPRYGLRRAGATPDFEDVAQDTLLHVLKFRPKAGLRPHTMGLAFRAARWLLVSWVRYREAQKRCAVCVSLDEGRDRDALADPAPVGLTCSFAEATEALPPLEKEVLFLRWAGYTEAEIAVALVLEDANAVEALTKRARRRLQALDPDLAPKGKKIAMPRAGSDRAGRDALITNNQRLVPWALKRMWRWPGLTGALVRRLGWEDAESAGTMGLIRAAEGYDPRRGVKFSTYAVPMISWTVRREAWRSAFAVTLNEAAHDSPNCREAAGRVLRGFRQMQVFAGEEERGEDTMPTRRPGRADAEPESPETQAAFAEALARLKPKTRAAFTLRMQGHAYRDIGKRTGEAAETARKRVRLARRRLAQDLGLSCPLKLRPMQEDALEALAEAAGPVSTRQLAKLAGYSYGVAFREALRELRDFGLAARTAERLWVRCGGRS